MTTVFLAIHILLAAFMLTSPAHAAPPPQVIATIKPIHSLAAMVMQGVGEPRLLIGTGASPHTYSLKPSDARALQRADVVFWVSENLETFLEKPLRTLPKAARVVELAEAPGVTLLAYRDAGPWEAHAHGSAETNEQTHNHDHGHAHDDAHVGADMHIWLDPANARAIVLAAAAALSEADPDRAELYRSNAETAVARLQALDDDLRQTLTPLAGRPYIVFHDAYQYFDRHYGLAGVGSITVHPELPPGAKRLSQIRDKIVAQQARCVFREPNFAPSLVDVVVADTDARTGVLDPEGAGLDAGPELYFQLMRNIAEALRACLTSSS